MTVVAVGATEIGVGDVMHLPEFGGRWKVEEVHSGPEEFFLIASSVDALGSIRRFDFNLNKGVFIEYDEDTCYECGVPMGTGSFGPVCGRCGGEEVSA